MEKKFLEYVGQEIPDTLPLLEDLEAGDITPDQYVQLREKAVGRQTFYETFLVPIFSSCYRGEKLRAPKAFSRKKS